MVRKVQQSYLPSVDPELLAGGGAADAVYDELCGAIVRGELTAGTPVHDGLIALHLGISRTPVREAFQRLRSIGVLETSPNRYTRITPVPPQRVRDALVVWTALFAAVMQEVVPHASDELVDTMADAHEQFVLAHGAGSDERMALTNFDFYEAALSASRNPELVSAIERSIYLIRLGGLLLPRRLDTDRMMAAQRGILEGFRSRDARVAHTGLDMLTRLTVPVD